MKALYRKYRPSTLAEVVGQAQVTVPLTKSLEQGKVSHAYLFVGPRGCGKTSVARILAHEVNGFKYEIEDNYVDIIEIDGASNRGIDNIRELREKVAIAPTSGKYKIYIIDEVHMLTKEAFNALLKTLEEPPKHAIFIMATTDAYKVPVTITSRAQVYTFRLADKETMFKFLKSVAEKEKIKISDDALEVIVKRGGGSFRDSLSLLDQLSSLSDKEITKELVISAMGLPQDEKIAELLNEYTSHDVLKITNLMRDILSSGTKPETLVEELVSSIILEPKVELLSLLSDLTDVKAPFAEAKLLVALTKPGNTSAGNVVAKQAVPAEASVTKPLSRPSAPARTSAPTRTPEPAKTSESPKSSEMNETIPKNSEPQITGDFNWNDFTEKVKKLNDAVYSQLIKTKYELVGAELHIYPLKKIVKNILSKDNNKNILIEAGGGVKVIIHEADETPRNAKKDETMSKISDIMGGEVVDDGGNNPFE